MPGVRFLTRFHPEFNSARLNAALYARGYSLPRAGSGAVRPLPMPDRLPAHGGLSVRQNGKKRSPSKPLRGYIITISRACQARGLKLPFQDKQRRLKLRRFLQAAAPNPRTAAGTRPPAFACGCSARQRTKKILIKTVEDEIEARELARIIGEFLDTLTAKERVIFMRRYAYADTYADIAKRVGIYLLPENEVKTSDIDGNLQFPLKSPLALKSAS